MVRRPSIGLNPFRKIQSSLAIKFGVLGLVFILVAAGAGGFVYIQLNDGLRDTTHENLKVHSDVQSSEVQEWLTGVRTSARTLSGMPELEKGSDTSFTRLFTVGAGEQKTPAGTSTVMLVNTQTKQISESTSMSMTGQTLGELNSFYKNKKLSFESTSDVWISEPHEFNGEPVIAVASPVSSERSLIILINLKTVSDTLLNDRVTTHAISQGGNVILSTEKSKILQDATKAGVAVPGAIDSGTVNDEFGVTEDGNMSMVTAHSEVKGSTMVVSAQREKAKAFAVIQTFVKTMTIAGGALFIAMLIIGVILRNLLRDLREMANEVTTLMENDYEASMETSRRDELGTLYNAFDEMASEVRTSLQEAREAEEEVREYNDYITAHVERFTDVMATVSDGNLTVRMDSDIGDGHDVEDERMDDLAANFNTMMDSVHGAVKEFKQFGQDVAASSEEVTAGVQEVRKASTRVSTATQEINDGTVEQADAISDTHEEMNELSASIEQVADSSDELSSKSERAAQMSRDGREAAEQASEAFTEIEDNTSSAVEAVEDLQGQIDEISEDVGRVSDIAEETTMLALNASIEAARAGESGDGFAVVAQNVKSLSDEAGQAADEIESSLEELQERTERTADDIDASMESVERGAETVQEALDSLDNIADTVEEMNRGIQEVDAAAEQQSQAAQDVEQRVRSIGNISEEVASQAGDVASAAEEQTASLTQVSQSVDKLSSRAISLSDKLEEFDAGLEDTEGEVVGIDEEEINFETPEFDAFDDEDVDDGLEEYEQDFDSDAETLDMSGNLDFDTADGVEEDVEDIAENPEEAVDTPDVDDVVDDSGEAESFDDVDELSPEEIVSEDLDDAVESDDEDGDSEDSESDGSESGAESDE